MKIHWKYVAIGFLVSLLYFYIDHLKDNYNALSDDYREQAVELRLALEDALGWKAAFEKARDAAEAHRETAAACMEREVQARQDRQERESILQDAKPRQRALQEQPQVIDDETRKRAADRLNRPL